MTGPRSGKGEVVLWSSSSHYEDIKRAQGILASVNGNIDKALSRAINKAVQGVKAEVVRQTTGEYYVKTYEVRKHIEEKRANQRRLQASIIASGRPIAMSKFKISPKTVPKQAGVRVKDRKKISVTIKQSGPTTKYKHAFLARFRSGYIGLVERTNKTTARGKRKLSQLYSLSIPQMIGQPQTITRLKEVSDERLMQELRRQVNLLLKKGDK